MTSAREQEILEECQQAIAYRFRQPELLRAALTHTSGANTRLASNERLEFLGDSVLGLVTCHQLFDRFPEYQEGEMTKVKSAVVSRKACARFSRELGLSDFLFVGRGMNPYSDSSNMNADVFESLVAAIYIDGGYEVAKAFILRFVDPEIDRVAGGGPGSNSKSLLQQVAQREFGDTPKYIVLDEQGPDHNKCFKVAVEVDRQWFPAAWGRNKKDAELRAAQNALAAIENREIPHPADF
jgi:ribonuclease-3